jgi:hypothetical protein
LTRLTETRLRKSPGESSENGYWIGGRKLPRKVRRDQPGDTGETEREREIGHGTTVVDKLMSEKSGSDMFRHLATQDRIRARQAAGEHGLGIQYARTDPRKFSFAVRAVENGTISRRMSGHHRTEKSSSRN